MLVVAGETIVDLIETPPGSENFEPFLGGGPYNVAKAAAKMGLRTAYLSPLSDDHYGDDFAAELDGLGVNILAARSHCPSGLAYVRTDDQGVPSYQFERENAADRDISLARITADFPANADYFYVGGLALAGGEDAKIWQDFCAQLSAPIFLDPNIRPSFITKREEFLARLDAIYKATDILKLSDEDIEWLAPDAPPREYFTQILRENAITIGFLTFGGEGAEVYFGDAHAKVSAPKITVKDTVGAGDCFCAASLAEISRTGGIDAQNLQSLGAVLAYATAAAAINCTRSGANAPTDQEVRAFLLQNPAS